MLLVLLVLVLVVLLLLLSLSLLLLLSHLVKVDNFDVANPCAGQIGEHRRCEPARADHEAGFVQQVPGNFVV